MDNFSPEFQSLFEGSPSLFLVLTPDPTFTITAVTNAYAKATLTVREEIIGKQLFEVFPDNPNDPHADGVEKLRSSLMRVLKNKTPDRMALQKYDIPIPGTDRFEEKYWSPYNTPVIDPSGKITSIIHQVTDVTETVRLQKIEKERDIERSNFRSLFMQTPEMVVILRGPDHIFEFVNEAHIQVLGFDATGKTVREAQPESVEIHGILDDVYRTGKTAALHEIPVTVTNRLRYFNLTYTAGRGEDGKINGIMIMGVEVTDQVMGREALKKAIKARDQFLSIASHELKTPLTSMKIQSQLFHKVSQDTKIAPMMNIIERGVNRLIHLVDDMLDISRIQLGKLSYEIEKVELSGFLSEVIERFRPDLENAGNKLTTDLSQKVTVNIDPFRIEQVITNLVTNAIRYAPQAPVELKLKVKGDKAVITFQDDGPGIPKSDHERIFDRFERLNTTTVVSGMGLGLFICREIIKGHGGTIEIDDNGVKGTCFIIKLPLTTGR